MNVCAPLTYTHTYPGETKSRHALHYTRSVCIGVGTGRNALVPSRFNDGECSDDAVCLPQWVETIYHCMYLLLLVYTVV